MARNVPMVSTAAVMAFLLFMAAAPAAMAYAVGGTGVGTTSSGSFDIGSSLGQLFSPFTGFLNSLTVTNPMPNVNVNTAPAVSAAPPPSGVDLNSASSAVKATLSRWAAQFDDWFYGISGMRLSEILYVALHAISWALGFAQGTVNWLLRLF